MALMEEDEEAEEEEEDEAVDDASETADEESESEGEENLEGPFHRRRRGKKFGHGIKKAVGVVKKVAKHDITKAVVRTAKAHLNKALALMEEDEEAEEEEGDEVVDDES